MGNTYGEKNSTIVSHTGYGIRVETDGHQVFTVQASLPRVLHGRNSMLIKTDAEMKEAVEKLDVLVRQIAIQLSAERKFSRVDLVWQFHGDIRVFILAHRATRHPEIRREPLIYPGETIAWEGKEARYSIYDKRKQMFKKQGTVIRAELQLHGAKLNRLLGNQNQRVEHLDFDLCYRAYRRFLCKFNPVPVAKCPTIASLLAYTMKSGNPEVFDIWALGKSRKQIQRVRRAIAGLRHEVFDIAWPTMLPPNMPPAPVEIEKSLSSITEEPSTQ
jgi:hypothetical protein